MSRVIEGTTAAGYRCDASGCDRVAVFAPCVMVPFEGYPIEVRAPMMCLVDVHVCPKHWRDIKPDEMMSKGGREAIEQCAADQNGRPAFKRAYLEPVRCHSAEFLTFQQRTGLIAPDDGLAKGSIESL